MGGLVTPVTRGRDGNVHLGDRIKSCDRRGNRARSPQEPSGSRPGPLRRFGANTQRSGGPFVEPITTLALLIILLDRIDGLRR